MKAPHPALAENTIAPSPAAGKAERSRTKGDAPTTIMDRYLIERDRQGRPERFYRDHRATDPVFRDEGRRLVSLQAYPDTVADMMKIAQHRGWAQVRVSGDETFKREAWIQGRALGLEIKGYRPRERDRQAAGEAVLRPTPERAAAAISKTTVEAQLKAASVVVRKLIEDPAARERLMERAVARVARQINRDRSSASTERTADPSPGSRGRERHR
jgi:hypothetical protein